MVEAMRANIKEMVALIGKYLYTDPGVVIRELIQNAYDSILERYGATAPENGRIDILTQKNAALIEIVDNGAGMTDDDLRHRLSVMGETLKKFHSSSSSERKLKSIGKYGIGFFAAFMISEKIIVTTKKEDSDSALRWFSVGDSEYDIVTVPDHNNIGTSVQLFLQRGSHSYGNSVSIERFVKRYCNYLDCPIYLDGIEQPLNGGKFPWELKNETAQDQCLTEHFDEKPLYFLTGSAKTSKGVAFSYALAMIDRIRHHTDLYCERMFVTNNLSIYSRYLPLDFVELILNCDKFSLDLSREQIKQDEPFHAVVARLEEITLKWLRELLIANKGDHYLCKIIKNKQADFKKLVSQATSLFDKLYPYLLFKLVNSNESVTVEEYLASWPSSPEKNVLFVRGGKDQTNKTKDKKGALTICESRNIPVILIETDEDQDLLRRTCNKVGAKLTTLNDLDHFFFPESATSSKIEKVSINIELLLGKKAICTSFEPGYLPMLIRDDSIILNKRNGLLHRLAELDIRPDKLRPIYFGLTNIFSSIEKVIVSKDTLKDIITPITDSFEKWIEDTKQSEERIESMRFLVDDWWTSPSPIEHIKEPKTNCFIACEFGNKDVINTTMKVCKEFGILAEPADEISNKPIFEKICAKIDACQFAIVDISQTNANVMLELGILIARRKPAIILRNATQQEPAGFKVPSDIVGIERIEYSNVSEDLTKKLRSVCQKIKGV